MTLAGRPDPKARPATTAQPVPQVRKVRPAPPEMMAHPEYKVLKGRPVQREPTAHLDRRDPKGLLVILEGRKVHPARQATTVHPVRKGHPAKSRLPP